LGWLLVGLVGYFMPLGWVVGLVYYVFFIGERGKKTNKSPKIKAKTLLVFIFF
jgi:hypothetical protein